MNNSIVQLLDIAGTSATSALVAIGLAISFRLMGVINLAHGEFIMIGAYTGLYLHGDWGMSWPVAGALSLLLGAVLGAVTEVLLIRRTYHSPVLSILATFGLSLVLRQVVQVWLGSGYRETTNPLPGATQVFGVLFPKYKLLLIAVAVLVLAVIIVGLQTTPLGVKVRAVAADKALAQTLGVRASRLNLLVFAGSAGVAALAGMLITPIATVSPSMGQDYLFTAFVVVIVGGARIWGVVVAAVLVAAVQNLTTVWFDPIVARVGVLALAFVALQWFRRSSSVSREVV